MTRAHGRINPRKRRAPIAKGGSNAIILTACARAGVPPEEFDEWLDDDQSDEYENCEKLEKAADMIKEQLFPAIRRGKVRAIILYLKTFARSRGYVE